MLTTEVVRAFPECVARDDWGYDHLVVPPGHELYGVLTALAH
jgi:hypothetical protein